MGDAATFFTRLWHGVWLRCPACGRGRQFETFFRMRTACAHCDLVFFRQTGEFTGALMFAQGFFGVLGLFGYMILAARFGPLAPGPLVWLAFGLVGLPIAFYRNVKGLWVGWLFAVEKAGR